MFVTWNLHSQGLAVVCVCLWRCVQSWYYTKRETESLKKLLWEYADVNGSRGRKFIPFLRGEKSWIFLFLKISWNFNGSSKSLSTFISSFGLMDKHTFLFTFHASIALSRVTHTFSFTLSSIYEILMTTFLSFSAVILLLRAFTMRR